MISSHAPSRVAPTVRCSPCGLRATCLPQTPCSPFGLRAAWREADVFGLLEQTEILCMLRVFGAHEGLHPAGSTAPASCSGRRARGCMVQGRMETRIMWGYHLRE